MILKIFNRWVCAAGCAVVAIMAGCATSPDARQYVFSSTDGWRSIASRDAASCDYVVRFTPVRLPAYLDRPQIVTRISENQISMDEFHRWGIPLDVTITELLGAGVARALPKAYVDVLPTRGQKDEGYQVQADIVRLDGVLGGEVDLIAQWKVSRADKPNEPIVQRLTRYQQHTLDHSYDAYVEAVRLCTTALSSEIAAVIELNEKK